MSCLARLLSLSLLTPVAFGLASGSARAEEVPDLPTVAAEPDPVRRLVSQAANPAVPKQTGERLFRQIVGQGSTAIPTLKKIFEDKRSSDLEAWVAARAMGRIGGSDVVGILSRGLTSSRVMVRLGAVSGLTLLRSQQSKEPLQRALKDKAMMVRSAAADALAAIGDPSSTAALLDALDLPANFKSGKSLFVRKHVVTALGVLGSLTAVPRLLDTIEDKDPEIRLASVAALTQITGQSFRPGGGTAAVSVESAEIKAWRTWWGGRSVTVSGPQ